MSLHHLKQRILFAGETGLTCLQERCAVAHRFRQSVQRENSSMLLELCVTELEDVATDTERIKSVPQPVIQESSHPYTHDAMQTGNVRIPGAESLRIEFDKSCSTERRHDPLTIMDGSGRIVSIRSGREWQDWCAELRVAGGVSFEILLIANRPSHQW